MVEMDPGGDGVLVKEGRVDKKSCTKVEARTSVDPGTEIVHGYSTCSNPWLVFENCSFKFDSSLQLKEEERMKVVVRVRRARDESGEKRRGEQLLGERVPLLSQVSLSLSSLSLSQVLCAECVGEQSRGS